MKKAVSGIMLTLLILTSMLTLALYIQPVRAWSGTVYIRADGTIDPPDAPIQRDGNTYTLTDNIYGSIVVLRSGVIIDGNGYTLQGEPGSVGFKLPSGYAGVTIKRINIKGFAIGIDLRRSLYNSIYENNITANSYCGIRLWDYSHYNLIYANNILANNWGVISPGGGILLVASNYNNIYENNIASNTVGAYFYSSSNNSIHRNNVVANNGTGIVLLYSSSNNYIYENNFKANTRYGIWLQNSSNNNMIFHNNFVNNPMQVYDYSWVNPLISPSINVWDDGYPSGGNHWSDYKDVDHYSGPNQDQPGSDGIWDHPYVIDENNIDRYPLVNAWTPTPPVQTWLFDSDFQYNLDGNYGTSEGTGHLKGTATLSAGNLSIEGQITLNGLLPSGVPEVYLIATDGQDRELAKQAVDLSRFSYWKTGTNTYNFTGQIQNVIQPINNGHYEVEALTTYGGQKYEFFINTASLINSHYLPLITLTPPRIPPVPSQPVNMLPADGAIDVDLTPTLVASPPLKDVPKELIPWEELDGCYVTRVDSQWQVTTIPGDYSNPVCNITMLGGLVSRDRFPELPEVWMNVIWHGLDYGTTYYWRVRYRDFRGVWSPWSKETSFTTIPWVFESDFTREMRSFVDRTKKQLDEILEEAQISAEDGDFFATQFKAKDIDLIVDSIFDALGTLSSGVHNVGEVTDLWRVTLSGGPETPWNHLIWLKHVYQDASFTAGDPSATTMDILRWALTYYAAEIRGEAPEQLGIEALKSVLKELLKSNLALQGKFIPSLERLIQNLKEDLDNTLSEVLKQIRDLTPEEVEAYRQDIISRRQANSALLSNLATLALPLHIARENWDKPGWKAILTEFFIRNLLKILIGLVGDGPGVLIYSFGTMGWDAFQNLAEQVEAAKMMNVAVSTVSNAFDTSKRIFLNTVRGLENIGHRVAPKAAQGQIVAIDNVVIAEMKSWFGRWDLFVKEAYSDVTISNTGSVDTIYELTATYGKWGVLGTSYTPLISQRSMKINAGRINTMRIYYYENGRYGELPQKGTEITFTLLGVTETGTYYIGTTKTTFGTTVISNTNGQTAPQQVMEEAQLIPYPIKSFIETPLNSTTYLLKISVENPLNFTISGNITQQLPDVIRIIDANGGIVKDNTVSWEFELEPGETRQYTLSFTRNATPLTIVEIPGTILNVYDMVQNTTVTFETDPLYLKTKFPIIVRAYPPTYASLGEEIKIPMDITNLDQNIFDGNIILRISDFDGNILYNFTYALHLNPQKTMQIELVAAPNISPGIYIIRGILQKDETTSEVFAEYISIDASNVAGIALLPGKNNHAGIAVKLGNFITTTNPDGSYYFLGIPAGNYSLIIMHPGYATIMQDVTVKPYGFTILPELSLIQIGIPPLTRIIIHDPKYVADNITYITSPSIIELIATDNPGGGVAQTAYRIYNASYDSGWITYSEPFYLTGLCDGIYYIDYNSTDYAGNIEPTNTFTVILDNTPPTTSLTIGEPKYIFDTTYVTPDTPFALEANDNAGSGVCSIAYRIYNGTYDNGWLPYTGSFYLTGLADGVYTIEFNSTDNLGNTEATKSIQVTLFSWNYAFEDTYGRGTILKINLAHKFFQFITPDKDYGIRKATYMRQYGRAIIIQHYDGELRLITVAVDTKLDFCVAIAWDKQTHKQYFLIDNVGKE